MVNIGRSESARVCAQRHLLDFCGNVQMCSVEMGRCEGNYRVFAGNLTTFLNDVFDDHTAGFDSTEITKLGPNMCFF